ncbi:MAG: hypothetical protein DRR42_06595 [Gammaproteobacteria bacterium]|nr:MAG: hypothetical protein DRR42_06595 [Gammaproteobacteria bacterium]
MQGIIRSQKTRLPSDYLDRQDDFSTNSHLANKYLANTRTLGNTELPVEFFMNVLRLNQGVPKDYFEQRTGLDFEYISGLWANLEREGLVHAPTKALVTTLQGHQFLDSILARF